VCERSRCAWEVDDGDERKGSSGSAENKSSGEETVRRERITGRDFAGADFGANEREQTRDVRSPETAEERQESEGLRG